MLDNEIIYLDNAATSFPKPPAVLERMAGDYARFGVSPGRGSYDLAVCASELVWEARKKVAAFFNGPAAERVIWTACATDALNTAILGLLKPGDHVISTRLEHNSVLRPLFHLREKYGITYDLVPFDGQGLVDPRDVEKAIKSNTRLVVVTHASNVLGTVQPIGEIGGICLEYGIPLVVDTAQSAGHIPVDMHECNISAVVFTGHKGLLGPAGIGGLVIDEKTEIMPTRYGGTGVDSHSLKQTWDYPHRLEAGTHNLPGIFGLSAALDYLQDGETGDKNSENELTLTKLLYEGLGSIDGVIIHSPPPQGVPVLTCSISGMDATAVGEILDGDYQIAVRTGLHCAPLVHETLGTVETGAVRFSPGPFNSREDILRAIEAMKAIAAAR